MDQQIVDSNFRYFEKQRVVELKVSQVVKGLVDKGSAVSTVGASSLSQYLNNQRVN